MKLSKKKLNNMLIWGGAILVIIIIIYSYNKKIFIENFRPQLEQQLKYDECISKNLETPFSKIAEKCQIPNNYHCDVYFKKKDVNNNFESKVIKGKCSCRRIGQDNEINFNNVVNAKAIKCKSKDDLYIKFYDTDGNILTYNSDKSNYGFEKYRENLYNSYKNIKQFDIKCTNLIKKT